MVQPRQLLVIHFGTKAVMESGFAMVVQAPYPQSVEPNSFNVPLIFTSGMIELPDR